MFLREQLKAIQKELGEGEGESDDGLKELRAKLDALELPEDARKEVDREWARLTRIGRESMESQVIRTYLETIAELPWNARSDEQLDVQEAARDPRRGPLRPEGRQGPDPRVPRRAPARAGAAKQPRRREADEAGRRETTASRSPAPTRSETGSPRRARKGRILLFVGPPGVGKTSIAKSIARAMGRKYVRISLGGARDEADIRGHRRTYVGAMPGRIIQGMKQAGTKNPVFLLDEVDKLGVSFQGDPASALLEVLDPAQNDTFTDHYLGVPFDLSRGAVHRDGELPPEHPGAAARPDGGRRVRRLHRAREARRSRRSYLVPRQLEENGLTAGAARAHRRRASREVIASYTRESGVRQLERELGKLARKVARQIAAREIERRDRRRRRTCTTLLGRPQVHPEKMAARGPGRRRDRHVLHAGRRRHHVRRGLADARQGRAGPHRPARRRHEGVGPRGLDLRALARRPGSASTRRTFERDVHIHVPAGAIPKDGPSAGVTMATALVSALSRRPVAPRRRDDRRDHAPRPRAADRRREGEDPRRGARRHHARSSSRRTTRPTSRTCPRRSARRSRSHPVTTSARRWRVTLRDTALENGRLLFGRPARRTRGRGRNKVAFASRGSCARSGRTGLRLARMRARP